MKVVLGDDCISRQAVIDMTGLSEWFDSSDSYNEFVIALSELPSVTPQERKGHWIDEGVYAEGHSEHAFMCSKCEKNYIGYTGDLKWCPNCGSDNREVEE